MRVWIYYDPTIPEAIIYGAERPEHFGRRRYDMGPIELDDDLVKRYEAAKEVWHDAHAALVGAVKRAGDLVNVLG